MSNKIKYPTISIGNTIIPTEYGYEFIQFLNTNWKPTGSPEKNLKINIDEWNKQFPNKNITLEKRCLKNA